MFARFVFATAVAATSLFSSYEPLTLELKAPFNDLFRHARTDEEYEVTGTLTYHDNERPVIIDGVTIGVRGNTSRQENECPFPKLKVRLPDAAARRSALRRAELDQDRHALRGGAGRRHHDQVRAPAERALAGARGLRVSAARSGRHAGIESARREDH